MVITHALPEPGTHARFDFRRTIQLRYIMIHRDPVRDVRQR